LCLIWVTEYFSNSCYNQTKMLFNMFVEELWTETYIDWRAFHMIFGFRKHLKIVLILYNLTWTLPYVPTQMQSQCAGLSVSYPCATWAEYCCGGGHLVPQQLCHGPMSPTKFWITFQIIAVVLEHWQGAHQNLKQTKCWVISKIFNRSKLCNAFKI
jgi:hypothetical protein